VKALIATACATSGLNCPQIDSDHLGATCCCLQLMLADRYRALIAEEFVMTIGLWSRAGNRPFAMLLLVD
jgi:hypothetical protein